MDEGTKARQSRPQRLLIERPRLTKLLDESEARFILLLAPAGYGKTTLAREWLRNAERVAWCAGGAAIADVVALASEIAHALFRLDSSPDAIRLLRRIEALASSGQGPHTLAVAVASWVASVKPSLLVIDDYHHASSSPESEAFMASFLPRTSVRLLLTSRSRPQWITARMVVYGETKKIGVEDLAFTEDEALQVLGSSLEASRDLLASAEGWPAVIALAATRGRLGGVNAGLLPADLYTFIADDLFRSMSDLTRHALFLFALGGDVAAVARELLGEQLETVLSEAADHGFVAVQASGDIAVHPLLKAFLLERLRGLGSSAFQPLLRRVVRALIKHEEWDSCLAALQQFPDEELLLAALKDAHPQLLATGRVTTLAAWVGEAQRLKLDDANVRFAEAEVALRLGDYVRAQALAVSAAPYLEDQEAAARAHLLAARAAHLSDDADGLERNCDRAEMLANQPQTVADALWLQLVHRIEMQQADSHAIFEQLASIGDESAFHSVRLAIGKAVLELETGTPQAALRHCESALSFMPYVDDPIVRTNALNVHAQVLLTLGDYEGTLDIAYQQKREAEASGLEFVIDYALISCADALIGVRRLGEARRVLAELEHRTSASSDFIVTASRLSEVKLRVAAGDLDAAAIILTAPPPPRIPIGLSGEYIAYRGLIAASRGDLARASTSRAEAAALSRYLYTVTVNDLTAAVTSVHRGQEDRASALLQRTLERGYIDALIVTCRAVPAIAAAAAREPATAASLTACLSRSRDFDLARQAGLKLHRELRRQEELSPREQDVYELLAQGRTNRQIADTLFISESTTKVHVRHIFEKLGVHTRVEAARMLWKPK